MKKCFPKIPKNSHPVPRLRDQDLFEHKIRFLTLFEMTFLRRFEKKRGTPDFNNELFILKFGINLDILLVYLNNER